MTGWKRRKRWLVGGFLGWAALSVPACVYLAGRPAPLKFATTDVLYEKADMRLALILCYPSQTRVNLDWGTYGGIVDDLYGPDVRRYAPDLEKKVRWQPEERLAWFYDFKPSRMYKVSGPRFLNENTLYVIGDFKETNGFYLTQIPASIADDTQEIQCWTWEDLPEPIKADLQR